MGTRVFDKLLECGCAISADGGGAVMPCYSEWGNMRKKKDKEAVDLCQKSWKAWFKSKEYKEHCKEVRRRNN